MSRQEDAPFIRLVSCSKCGADQQQWQNEYSSGWQAITCKKCGVVDENPVVMDIRSLFAPLEEKQVRTGRDPSRPPDELVDEHKDAVSIIEEYVTSACLDHCDNPPDDGCTCYENECDVFVKGGHHRTMYDFPHADTCLWKRAKEFIDAHRANTGE